MRASVPSRFFLFEPLHRLGKGAGCFGGAALLALSAAMTPIASAQMAGGSTGMDASGNAKSEMAACKSGKTPQARATCLNEARNAQAAKRAGKLQNYGDFSANAMKRCEVFKDSADREACQARLMDQAKVEGSVAEGGILREAETPMPADATTDAGSMPMQMQGEMPASADTMPMPMNKPMPMPKPRRKPMPMPKSMPMQPAPQ